MLLVTNGDPGLPFATIINMTPSWPVLRTADHCLPVVTQTPYGPPLVGNGPATSRQLLVRSNFPTCIMGQIYYDGALQVDNTVVSR